MPKDIRATVGTHRGELEEGPDLLAERSEIPKFDLAEQIMAEQRRNASALRKGPSGTPQTPKRLPRSNPPAHIVMSQSMSLGQEQIIADIVARDIERLCRNRA